MTGRQVAEDVWREQSLWSQSANQLRARIQSARVAALCVTSAVAVLGTSATAVGTDTAAGRALAGVAAFGAVIVTLLQRGWSGPEMIAWTRARSVSEALKSEVYLWLAGAGAYTADDGGTRLRARADEVSSSAHDLSRYQLGLQAEQRALPDVVDGTTYFENRVTVQIKTYYTPGAQKRATRLTWSRRAQLTLAVLAAALGAVSAATSAPLTPWIAVLTTIGLAVAAHVAATRYEFQLIEFLRTAAELTRLRRLAELATDDAQRRQFAVEAESVISVENQGWMARLTQDESPPV